jgi:predicted O-methyltransferase YrrM
MWDSGIEHDSRVDTVIQLLTAYKHEIEEGRVELVVEYSQKFLRSMDDGYFDFLYIDASHSYEDTLAELRGAYGKLRKGGLLLGDDYDPDPISRQHGVFRAVNEFADETGAKIVLNKTRQWGLALSN